MYRIIIAGPKGPWGEYTIAPTDEASVFFSSEQAQCVISLDPSTIDQYDGKPRCFFVPAAQSISQS